MNIDILVKTAAAGTPIATVPLYPFLLPDNATLPAMTYQIVSSVNYPTFSSSGMQRDRVQFDCWSGSYTLANTNRDNLILALNRFGGSLSDGTSVNRVTFLAKHDDFVYESKHYRLLGEFYVFYAL